MGQQHTWLLQRTDRDWTCDQPVTGHPPRVSPQSPLWLIHFHADTPQQSLDVLYLQLISNVILHCPLQAGVCMCEEGFTEVLSHTGQLDQCAPIPILEIPTAGDKKGDVKTSRAINPTLPTTIQPGRTGRTWYLQPYGPGQTTWHTCLLLVQIHTRFYQSADRLQSVHKNSKTSAWYICLPAIHATTLK